MSAAMMVGAPIGGQESERHGSVEVFQGLILIWNPEFCPPKAAADDLGGLEV